MREPVKVFQPFFVLREDLDGSVDPHGPRRLYWHPFGSTERGVYDADGFVFDLHRMSRRTPADNQRAVLQCAHSILQSKRPEFLPVWFIRKKLETTEKVSYTFHTLLFPNFLLE